MKDKIIEIIKSKLVENKDEEYRLFHSNLVPNVDKEKFIGVRVPLLRKVAKEIIREFSKGEIEIFLSDTPHDYYEENQLHSFIIDYLEEDFNKTLERTEAFLPYIDNWAVCDSFKPRALKKDLKSLYEILKKWEMSKEPYKVRLAIVLQISWYLDKEFQENMLEEISQVSNKWKSDIIEKESSLYYVQMAIAWYFSMALVKQYDKTIEYFKVKKLPIWVHNKALQKAIESRQIEPAEKEEFKKLKIVNM